MITSNASEAAKAVVRRNTEEVQGGGNFAVFDELFADDFLDHTPQPGRTPDKAGARELYDAPGRVFGLTPTGRKIPFETVDVVRVRDGQIAEHWGVANLFSLMQQLGALPANQDRS